MEINPEDVPDGLVMPYAHGVLQDNHIAVIVGVTGRVQGHVTRTPHSEDSEVESHSL